MYIHISTVLLLLDLFLSQLFCCSSKPTGGAGGSFGQDNAGKSGHANHKSITVPSDWMCISCGYVNFARRTSCFQVFIYILVIYADQVPTCCFLWDCSDVNRLCYNYDTGFLFIYCSLFNCSVMRHELRMLPQQIYLYPIK